jgi:hypothetical protein
MVVLAMSVRRARYPIFLIALALLVPARATAAEPPQIYVGSGSAYTVAFKIEGVRVSVLALDAPLYCSETEPSHHFQPGSMSVFPAPTPMRIGPDGLEAPSSGGGPSPRIEATFDGKSVSGVVAFDSSEGPFHCQTAGYYPTRPEVPFEAVRYEPIGSGATKPPGKDEIPVYYGSEGGNEVLLETTSEAVTLRGSVPSKCPVRGKRIVAPRTPWFGDVTGALRRGEGFRRTLNRQGKVGGKSWKESTLVSAVLGEEDVAGFYERTTVIRPKKGSPHRCTTGALPFRALRYLPAAG